MTRRWITLLVLAISVVCLQATAAHASGQPPLIVSPDGPYTTIPAALIAAGEGDVIEVHGGHHRGPLVVDKPVHLEGVGWPVIDAGGEGTVVMLTAPDIIFRGFTVRGSGVEPDRDHAGITLSAPRILVENNRVEDVLFGIFVAEADDSIVRGNEVTSKEEYDSGRKGDGIRLWYSQRVTVEANHVYGTRDLVIWYSSNLILRQNVVENGRYGVHLMYCDGAQIEGNHLLNNSVGVYTMYSDNVTLRHNLLRGQRGPSGYALGFKDADNVTVTGNVLVDNGAAVYLDGTPFSPQGSSSFQDNILAFNDVGIIMQPSVRGNVFSHNTFWENVEQVAVQGGGMVADNQWQGNYWSDYSGFDADSDGQGDVPYQAERFFESMTDREPKLRALLYSPAAQAIEFTAQAFPIIRPQPKLTDVAPVMGPADIPAFARPSARSPRGMIGLSIALLGLGVGCGALAFGAPSRQSGQRESIKSAINAEDIMMNDTIATLRLFSPQKRTLDASPVSAEKAGEYSLLVDGTSKQYGQTQALCQVSFAAAAGEALALWGANGAGKTTLLKAILGLIDFQGKIEVEGHDVQRNGKEARRYIGYVPQEAVFYDLSVEAMMTFYARLKKAPVSRIPGLLSRLGLAEHSHKPVPALSGGLKQRLALAIALLSDPLLLLLDEPTANLDAQARREYLSLLAELRREGKTILFASHRLEEVEALADRVLWLEQGQLVESLTPAELREQLAPEVELTLWVEEGKRPAALAYLQEAGLKAHLNGRGTVVAHVSNGQKMTPLYILQAQGIAILDFETAYGAKRQA